MSHVALEIECIAVHLGVFVVCVHSFHVIVFVLDFHGALLPFGIYLQGLHHAGD